MDVKSALCCIGSGRVVYDSAAVHGDARVVCVLFIEDRMNSPYHDTLSGTVCLVVEILEIYQWFQVACASPFVFFFFLLNARLPSVTFPLFRTWSNGLVHQAEAWLLLEGGVALSVRSLDFFGWTWHAIFVTPVLRDS